MDHAAEALEIGICSRAKSMSHILNMDLNRPSTLGVYRAELIQIIGGQCVRNKL